MGTARSTVTTSATEQVQLAVRQALGDLSATDRVLIACSGGPDSLALAYACSQLPLRAGVVVVDHQLQVGSAAVARKAAEQCVQWGLNPVLTREVVVGSGPGHGGPEAAARTARREALIAAADELNAAAILLGHTRDDQAETVLLRLMRGSGARTLAAMAPREGIWRRPLLDVPRAIVHASVSTVSVWRDPHNIDPTFARVRVREHVLPAMTTHLGDDIVMGLSRSARMLRDDADALDHFSQQVWEAAAHIDCGTVTMDIQALEVQPRAVRTRLLRRAAITAGSPPAALTLSHVERMEAFVIDWRGQGAIALPGGVSAERAYARLRLSPSLQAREPTCE